MKPAAVLISALEINVGWPGQIRLMPEHGDVAGTGFEPDVDDIGLFAEFSSATFAALGSSGKCVGFGRIPGIGAEAAEEVNHFAIERRIIQRLAATFAQEHGDGHAPDTLARDAPVRPCCNHVGDALFAPGRIPLHFLDLIQRAAAQRTARHRRFHRDEPLLGRSEDDGIVAAPAVRIRVLDFFRVHQYAALFQQFDDRLVSGKNLLTVVLG